MLTNKIMRQVFILFSLLVANAAYSQTIRTSHPIACANPNVSINYFFYPDSSPCQADPNGKMTILNAIKDVDYKIVTQTAGSLTVSWLRAINYPIVAVNYSCPGTGNIPLQLGVTVNAPPPSLPVSAVSLAFTEAQDVVLKIPNYSRAVRWNDNTGTFIGVGYELSIGARKPGSYTFTANVLTFPGECSFTGTSSATVTVTVSEMADTEINTIEDITFDEVGAVKSNVKKYYDVYGKLLQTQAKNITRNEVLATQPLFDEYERQVIETLPAPINRTSFRFRKRFVEDGAGNYYESGDYNVPVGTRIGTLGWYYSSNNNKESHVPATGFPYSRKEFYNEGSGDLKKEAMQGDQHRIGSGHEILTGNFPLFSELDHYRTYRDVVIPRSAGQPSIQDGFQKVVKDENGYFLVSIYDTNGKPIMSAGNASKGATLHTLKVTNSVQSSVVNTTAANYRPLTYFYILTKQAISITTPDAAQYVIEDVANNTVISPAAGQQWEVGFYRIILSSGTINFSYSNYFDNLTYTYYDVNGKTVCQVTPNGVAALQAGTAFASVDKTTYKYDINGRLVSGSQSDAGTSNFKYRSDGKLRFSQNALQRDNEFKLNGKGRFSYTHFDVIGRPIESGEYIGSTYTFANVDAQLELASQVVYQKNQVSDWVRTRYDYPDPNPIPNLPSAFKQEFVRGAVSKMENAHVKTWYSYNESDKLMWMAQKPAYLNKTFLVQYTYDLGGNVLTIMNATYGAGGLESAFYHHYEYDGDKRLFRSFTSTDGVSKRLRATYHYYLHGPLKRIQLGDGIQGIDFVYNINGWVTQINHPDKSLDPGGDNNDVFGMLIDYYDTSLVGLFTVAGGNMEQDPIQRFHQLPLLSEDSYFAVATSPTVSNLKEINQKLLQIKQLRQDDVN